MRSAGSAARRRDYSIPQFPELPQPPRLPQFPKFPRFPVNLPSGCADAAIVSSLFTVLFVRLVETRASMKHATGILGYLAVACVATFTIKECTAAITRSSAFPVANSTANHEYRDAENAEIENRDEDEDDFVPYQGERFSVFDWTLFRAVSKKYPGNVLLSPISLKIALVLLYEGAQDETARELAAAMQLPATRTATRDRFSTILRSLQTDSPAYTFNVGTRIYIDSIISVRQRYQAIAKAFYQTDAITANFSDARPIVRAVNHWVSNLTHANIDRIIEDENSAKNSLMLIVNALFFKGSWRRKYFSPENTRVGKFSITDKETVDVPFMRAFGRFYYSESTELDAKILRIPYEGHKFAMYLMLPRTSNGIEQLTNEVNPFVLTRHVWLMQDLPVDVLIPKFKFQFSSHLEPILRELGIRDIFDDTATLTGIARTKKVSKHLKVTDILQKAGIEVNENGTTAYVATEVEIGNKIEDESFYANRPFLFFIEDESTGTIIYIGRITNPLDTAATATPIATIHPSLPSKLAPPIFDEGSILQAGLNAEDRNNLFNAYFSQVLNEEYKDGNLACSPAGAKIALSMLSEGADGGTKSELVSVLRLPEDESRREKLAQRTLASLKRNENGTEVDLAARLWIGDVRVRDEYKNTIRSRYEADAQSVTFLQWENTARLINEWVRRVTRDSLSSPIAANNLPPDTRLVLTSAVYFKGRWLKSFDKANTKLQCFHLPNGKCRNTYFMRHESTYRYAYIPAIEAHILEIPYSDGKTSMLTFMPVTREKDPHLRILLQDLATVPVSAILASLRKQTVTVHLPKFSIQSSLDLSATLQRLGVSDIFRTTSNFTKMVSTGSVRVTTVLQTVKIEVDEEGTLAAADTEIGYVLLSAWGNDVKMDRPFLFSIIDTVTGTTLFTGRFVEPL